MKERTPKAALMSVIRILDKLSPLDRQKVLDAAYSLTSLEAESLPSSPDPVVPGVTE